LTIKLALFYKKITFNSKTIKKKTKEKFVYFDTGLRFVTNSNKMKKTFFYYNNFFYFFNEAGRTL